MRTETTLEGVVERITYSNEETGWSVVKLSVRGRGQVTAVGNLLGVQPGESLRLTGRWVRDRKYGEQFMAVSYLTVKPATFVGIERYLASGLVKGIGREMARRLVQRFGLDTLDVIDRHPERLTEVEGIGPVRSERIREAWCEQREIRDVMVFLQSHGVSSNYAVKIYKRYGADAVAVVRENPYRLSEDVFGIGFKTADKIARDLGIPEDSPHRAAAGVLHALRRAGDEGHCFQPEEELVAAATELLGIGAEAIRGALDELLGRGELAAVPLPAGEACALYLTALETAERGVAERLRALTGRPLPPLALDVDRALEWIERREAIELGTQQRETLRGALTAKLLVLTGGPGTGKTTLVRGVVRILGKKGLRILLAAPTGRAAKRLSEATGAEAKTIHRMLEYNPRHRAFVRDAENPLEADLVVIDEASMVDVVLAYHVLKAVPDEARLLLVGDVDQLPSVGPGRVLADVLASGVVAVARLTEIFRQAQRSRIVVNAHRVRRGELPYLEPASGGEDFFFIERDEPEELLATVKHLVAERIPRSFGLDPMDAIQVLTPMQKGLLGAANLNAELQALLNPGSDGVTRAGKLLRTGDRVMQVRNNYDLDVFNGDVGRVAAIDQVEQRLAVDFDGRRVEYDFSELDELTLGYASSIHKSQGSEYPGVVLPLHTQHYAMLQRNLLYTALTRGRRLVVVVGSRRALAVAVRSRSSGERKTLLAERLRGELPEAAPRPRQGPGTEGAGESGR